MKASGCIRIFNIPNGTFDDGSGPGKYRAGMSCLWVIITQANYRIQATISYQLEGSESLASLAVYDGYNATTLQSKFSATSAPSTVLVSQTNSVLFEFKTSKLSRGADGFAVAFEGTWIRKSMNLCWCRCRLRQVIFSVWNGNIHSFFFTSNTHNSHLWKFHFHQWVKMYFS